ncbi:uncharacterized protein A4U43_C04F35480 [Asparagus officinalis]|uniref:ABC transmembrane type-1 domain-containing protein n=1 Tax=Asparagus officinalis TaxID=4686 RepID=A0A5P1F8S1_ASPOF|nr:uncharacterized protein A4U43_C04F35480 [Asparagus officinalis]
MPVTLTPRFELLMSSKPLMRTPSLYETPLVRSWGTSSVMGTFVSGFIVRFTVVWQLALVTLAIVSLVTVIRGIQTTCSGQALLQVPAHTLSSQQHSRANLDQILLR